jgi:hypothetical protein
MFQIFNPQMVQNLISNLPFLVIFAAVAAVAAVYMSFLLFSLLAHGKGILLNLWGHILLLLDACTGILIELSLKCFCNVLI